MIKLKNLKLLIAVILLAFAFKDNIKDYLPDFIKPTSIVVEVSKPADEFINFSKDFLEGITSKQELSELAVLNDEYASKLVSYTSPSTGQVNQLYQEVIKEVFSNKYVGKYPTLKGGILLMFKDVQGAKERSMSPDDLTRLSNLFRGLSWNLVEKLNSK